MKALYICLLVLPNILPRYGSAPGRTGVICPAADRNEWTLRREKDGINVYSRRSDFSKFNDTRVDADLPGTIQQLAGILLDVDRYSDWVYATRTSRMVRKLNPNEVIYYAEVGTPWPASNRDYYADMKISFNADGQSMTVVSVGMKDYQPEKKDLVRVPLSRGYWTVTTTGRNKIHLQYILEIDPGGAVPAWILNNFASRAPLETFAKLKKKMEDLNR
ncbi:MAG TPA: START domain-containing protein [Puia sp.]|nr:START domain-containing protein [Puia sp.]